MSHLKEILQIFIKVFETAVKGPRRPAEIFHHIHTIAYGSFPIVMIATIFAGTVVTGEIALHMDLALQTVDMVPGVTGQFIFREIAIIIPALLLVAKTGAGIAAEVATMKVTEQVDALRLLRIDPVEFLVFPRVVASIISTCCLTLIAVFISLTCAIIYSSLNYGFSYMEYVLSLKPFLNQVDLLCAICKAAVFGGIVPIISCFYGFRCPGGADGVGMATTNSVVTSTLVVVIFDFFLTFLFSLLM